MEAQLDNARDHRAADTLQWASGMPEFQAWRLSDPKDFTSPQRILWIRGTLGVGKSTMAGYYIDLLTHLYPSSTIAYFFFKSVQPGLTKAVDCVRTLAYQFIQNDTNASSILEQLQINDFRIDGQLGVSFLFKRLVRTTFLSMQCDAFIVVDGLDEADTTVDIADRVPRPEIEVLIECLATLPVRLLFISRTNADIARIVPNSITKPITKEDNMTDIMSHVKQTTDASTTLQMHFRNVQIDPLEYFRDNAKSIFLWVALVLKQLERARSASAFRKTLDGFLYC